MKASWRTAALVPVVAAACLLFVSSAGAAVPNGGFEKGSLKNWSIDNKGNAGSWFVYSGTETPGTFDWIDAPPEGSFAAVTDQFDPGAHVLYTKLDLQGDARQLGFYLYYQNRATDRDRDAPVRGYGPAPKGVDSCSTFAPTAPVPCAVFCSPPSVKLNKGCNQQYRVDILRFSADPFSMSSHDVLRNLFQTEPGDPAFLCPTWMSFDLRGLPSRVTLRFLEIDNQDYFHAAVDGVVLGERH